MPHIFLRAFVLAFLSNSLIIGLTASSTFAQETSAQNGAVVIMYQRFDEPSYPTASTGLEILRSQITKLKSGSYNILSLSEITDAYSNATPLPDRSIAITVDGAYQSFYETAWPEFKQAGLPVTLFVSTAVVDRNEPGYMTWSQLRELAADPLITIGSQSHELKHIVNLSPAAQKLAIDTSNQLFRRALGKQPSLFAYPYGEISNQLSNIIRATGFRAAFGQHSGATTRGTDPLKLPRFPFNDRFGTPERFALAINSLPLPITAILPEDLALTKSTNPPSLGFTISPNIKPREDGSYRGLNCYSSQGDLSLLELGGGRIEVRLSEPFKAGRARINCTMLGPDGRWRWFGQQYYIPK